MVNDQLSAQKTAGDIQKTQHLESIAALSGGIAHDYNNLLTVIIGNISLIQSYVDANDIIFRLLNEALEASMVAKSLTQKLITFSKGGSPVKETADMAALLQVVTEFSLSGSNIKCRFDIPDGLALVDIDKTQVSQALHNLVMNARDAMPNGGMLTVTASNVQNIDAEIESATGGYVKISINDRGPGIPPENLERIYDPYFSTKERGHEKGTGLGLSICHSIIQKHDGIMEIESSMGEGTVVHIYLPASEQPEIKDTEDRISHSETLGIESGCGRILVMDDENMITKMAGRILARLGYEAEFAQDGGEAVKVYQSAIKSGSPFDAVILDLTVRGGMGGEEAVQQLHKLDPTVKAIVSSGYSDSPVMHNFTDYGFCDAIVKPYSLSELGQALNRALNPESQAKSSDIWPIIPRSWA
jgi:nitrogen-specific signal transduction histidine kinase/ActR/RegA family two-component response regulator